MRIGTVYDDENMVYLTITCLSYGSQAYVQLQMSWVDEPDFILTMNLTNNQLIKLIDCLNKTKIELMNSKRRKRMGVIKDIQENEIKVRANNGGHNVLDLCFKYKVQPYGENYTIWLGMERLVLLIKTLEETQKHLEKASLGY